jgi:hypothetical protein
LDAATKAIRTAKWATTMTKWHIGFETNVKRLGSVKVSAIRRWQLVGFPGAAGRESLMFWEEKKGRESFTL